MIVMILDDPVALRQIDRSGTLPLMEETSTRLAPPPDAGSTCSRDFGKTANVVFGGMGGSGIVGEILVDFCRDAVDTPVSVCRTMRMPRFVAAHTLFVAISYSGETQETLWQVEQARKQGASIVLIGSGGQMLSEVTKLKVPYLKVRSGLVPRVALPELVGAAIFALGQAEILGDTSALLAESSKSLGEIVRKLRPSVPSHENPAKHMAQTLVDKLPLLVGNEEFASVLRRFKNELNENSKMPAFYYTIPEAYHDDVEGLQTLKQLVNVQPLLLRMQDETGSQRRTREVLETLLRELGFPKLLYFEGSGPDKLSQLLTAVMFGDYVSVYLAALRGVDPSELKVIPNFRRAMRGD